MSTPTTTPGDYTTLVFEFSDEQEYKERVCLAREIFEHQHIKNVFVYVCWPEEQFPELVSIHFN